MAIAWPFGKPKSKSGLTAEPSTEPVVARPGESFFKSFEAPESPFETPAEVFRREYVPAPRVSPPADPDLFAELRRKDEEREAARVAAREEKERREAIARPIRLLSVRDGLKAMPPSSFSEQLRRASQLYEGRWQRTDTDALVTLIHTSNFLRDKFSHHQSYCAHVERIVGEWSERHHEELIKHIGAMPGAGEVDPGTREAIEREIREKEDRAITARLAREQEAQLRSVRLAQHLQEESERQLAEDLAALALESERELAPNAGEW